MNEDKKYAQIQMLKEMVESMTDSIDNLTKLIEQQGELVKLIVSSEKKDYFDEFIKGMEKQLSNSANQRETLIKRRDLLEAVCNVTDLDDQLALTVNNLLIGLGIFN